MITIRKANKKDIINLTTLFDNYRVFYENESDIENAKIFLFERLTHNDLIIFIAENAMDELMGFVQLYPIFSSTRMKRLWLLNDLYIKEKHRGKGISKDLIKASKQLCAETNACGILLETAKTNAIGNSLYEKSGFQLDNEHNYYSWDR